MLLLSPKSGSGGGSYSIAISSHVENGTFEFYNTVWDDSEQSYAPTGDAVTSFQCGSIVAALPKPNAGYGYADKTAELWVGPDDFGFPVAHIGTGYLYFVMPSENCEFFGEFTED